MKLTDIRYKRWNYGVTYRKDTKIKDKYFDDEETAKVFFEKQRRNFNGAVFFRFKRRHFLENLFDGHVIWIGRQWRIDYLLYIAAVFAAFITLWRTGWLMY